jgi:hypothetical protein
MATVAVDFDGVIHTYDKGWQDGTIYGEFMPGAVVGLTRLMQQYAVFIHTARKPRQVARWIERSSGYGLECTTRVPRGGFWSRRGYLLVTNRKLPAVAYIDDRAVRFESWDRTLDFLSLGAPEVPVAGEKTGLDKVADAVRLARGGEPPVQLRGFA